MKNAWHSQGPTARSPEMDMGWVHPWVGLGWVGLGRVLSNFRARVMGWVGLGENLYIFNFSLVIVRNV